MRQISQRDARRLRKRVNALESAIEKQRQVWSQEYVGGVEIGRAESEAMGCIPVAVRTARQLEHAVVVVGSETGLIRFIALPQAKR